MTDVVIDDVWPFRDYVIRSLNDDRPFNQFIVEHLAGDVIGKDQPEIEVEDDAFGVFASRISHREIRACAVLDRDQPRAQGADVAAVGNLVG